MEEEFDYEVMVILPNGDEEFTTVTALDETAAGDMALEEYEEGATIKQVVQL